LPPLKCLPSMLNARANLADRPYHEFESEDFEWNQNRRLVSCFPFYFYFYYYYYCIGSNNNSSWESILRKTFDRERERERERRRVNIMYSTSFYTWLLSLVRAVRFERIHELWKQKRFFFSFSVNLNRILIWSEIPSRKLFGQVGECCGPCPAKPNWTKSVVTFFFNQKWHCHSTKGYLVTNISFALYK